MSVTGLRATHNTLHSPYECHRIACNPQYTALTICVSQESVQPTIHCTHLKCVTGMRATHNTLHSPYMCHRNACNPQYTALTLSVSQECVQPTIHCTHLMCVTGMRATHNTPHSPYVCHRNACNPTHNTLHSPYVCHRNACNPQYTALTLCVPQECVQPTIHRTHLHRHSQWRKMRFHGRPPLMSATLLLRS